MPRLPLRRPGGGDTRGQPVIKQELRCAGAALPTLDNIEFLQGVWRILKKYSCAMRRRDPRRLLGEDSPPHASSDGRSEIAQTSFDIYSRGYSGASSMHRSGSGKWQAKSDRIRPTLAVSQALTDFGQIRSTSGQVRP